jgi:hypothetical protein
VETEQLQNGMNMHENLEPEMNKRNLCSKAMFQNTGEIHALNLQSHPCRSRSKAIPVTGRGGPQSCEVVRIPNCLDNRITEGGEVVGLAHRPGSIPQKYLLVPISVRGGINSWA